MMRGRELVNRIATLIALVAASLAMTVPARAEDGYDLWLRYAPLEGEALERLREFNPGIVWLARPMHRIADRAMVRMGKTETLPVEELHRGLVSLLDGENVGSEARTHNITFNCFAEDSGPTGSFTLQSVARGILIESGDEAGCLYGAYALLRELSLGADPATINITSAPAMPLRMLNHWDNPDGHVERGYAGRSIFAWWHLPERLDQRMIDYARANASIGINAVAVNNVNARAFMLEADYIAKLTRLADAWRPYGIRVFLSARFSAPVDIGGLETADPLDPAVRAWWQAKADEIYASIPDFGGFLVKANSEGQPGPQDYGRTHADGANMMAEALWGRGTVIWRAFVYSAEDDTDRAMQAFNEFIPLDGQFADNVIVQVKNGPIDFQPREPFHPMFGAMPDTNLMLEAQITKEYLGFASHLAFLAPMWEEVLDTDTGYGATVAEVVAPVGMAGVANTGSDRNWTGSDFDQANWYAFGRLAWDPSLDSEQIAREWAAQTFSHDDEFLGAVTPMMMRSREAVVDYMTPLGLAHLMATGHHYGPGPWVCDLPRPEWNPCYYHRADARGIGFDRTATGSNALSQYLPEIAEQWADPQTIDPQYLLWFHRVGWRHAMPSGRTLWEEMVHRYDRGVAQAGMMAQTWAALGEHVDKERYRAVSEMLEIQSREARWWRDASLAYWQARHGIELPEGAAPIPHDLDYYSAITFPEAPGN